MSHFIVGRLMGALVVALFASVGHAQTINTVAGGGPVGPQAALEVGLGYPRGVAFDANGNLYIAAAVAHRVLRVTPSGTLTVVAGNGSPGFSGDGGPATTAGLTVSGIAVDASVVPHM